jgi:hypothetical protein
LTATPTRTTSPLKYSHVRKTSTPPRTPPVEGECPFQSGADEQRGADTDEHEEAVAKLVDHRVVRLGLVDVRERGIETAEDPQSPPEEDE